jgi:integrase
MNKSLSRNRRGDKPRKPSPDYPLTAHPNGQWSKKIKGRVHYFGPWADPQAALQEWLRVKDDLLAGRKPRPRDGFTVKDLANHYLTSKKDRLDAGELSPRTFHDYHAVCERMVTFFDNGSRLVEDIGPDDFRQLRASLAKTLGPVSLGNEIRKVKMLFGFAFNNGHIDRPVRYGSEFQGPPKRVLRLERKRKPARMFESKELKSLVDSAEGPIKAMILLAINCGFGQGDCSNLPLAALDLDGGWVDFHRPKTGIDRRCPLWKETVAALREAIANRPEPRDEKDRGLVFVTKYGQRWVRSKESKKTPDKLSVIDGVAQEFGKLMKALGLTSKRGFYSLRHTFETIAGESRDQVPVDAIMGHAPPASDMSAVYRERISDERLRAVSDFVHAWLFG